MPKYSAKDGHTQCKVLLYGVQVHDVISCDTDRGELTKYARNPDGSFKVENGHLVTEVWTGEVTVEDSPLPTHNTDGHVTHRR